MADKRCPPQHSERRADPGQRGKTDDGTRHATDRGATCRSQVEH